MKKINAYIPIIDPFVIRAKRRERKAILFISLAAFLLITLVVLNG